MIPATACLAAGMAVRPACHHRIDHFSRASLGFAVFDAPPSSKQVAGFLNRLIAERGKPKHMISDKSPQFDCDNYKSWAYRIDIKLRFGKIGMHGSITAIERFFNP